MPMKWNPDEFRSKHCGHTVGTTKHGKIIIIWDDYATNNS
jgi:hypothetical protein